MTATFDHLVVSSHQGRTADDLVDAPVDALHGVSAADARRLDDAFGINTIGELARNRFVRAALAIEDAHLDLDSDPGPDPGWGAFFAAAPLTHYEQHPAGRFRLDFGPVYYRGRLDGTARVLVVGQDPAANEIVGHRIFVGTSGQRLQGFLAHLGISRDYVMINAFLYSVFGQVDAELRAISLEAPILDYRNDLLDRIVDTNPIRAVIAVGAGAEHALDHWLNPTSLAIERITHPAAQNVPALLAEWNTSLATLRPLIDPEPGVTPVTTPYGTAFADTDHIPIPRRDLPFGMPVWHGDGSHATRDGNEKIVWDAS